MTIALSTPSVGNRVTVQPVRPATGGTDTDGDGIADMLIRGIGTGLTDSITSGIGAGPGLLRAPTASVPPASEVAVSAATAVPVAQNRVRRRRRPSAIARGTSTRDGPGGSPASGLSRRRASSSFMFPLFIGAPPELVGRRSPRILRRAVSPCAVWLFTVPSEQPRTRATSDDRLIAEEPQDEHGLLAGRDPGEGGAQHGAVLGREAGRLGPLRRRAEEPDLPPAAAPLVEERPHEHRVHVRVEIVDPAQPRPARV